MIFRQMVAAINAVEVGNPCAAMTIAAAGRYLIRALRAEVIVALDPSVAGRA